MVFHFVILSDEIDDFRREISIDAEATFLEFQNAILKSCNYKNDQMTSFFICKSNWSKKTEIAMLDMNEDPTKEQTLIMEKTHLGDLLEKEKTNLLFLFDPICERYLYIQLQSIEQHQHLLDAKNTLSKGNAPEQTKNIEDMFGGMDMGIDDDEGYNPDEIDLDGYQNLEDIEGSNLY